MATILVVDDDAAVRTMLRRLFEPAGYDVEVAVDGHEALSLYKKRPYDLVIMDLFMRGKGGIEAIIGLRKLHPNAKIIAISGADRKGPADHLKLAEGLGVIRSFAKPLPLKEFLKAVREALS